MREGKRGGRVSEKKVFLPSREGRRGSGEEEGESFGGGRQENICRTTKRQDLGVFQVVSDRVSERG